MHAGFACGHDAPSDSGLRPGGEVAAFITRVYDSAAFDEHQAPSRRRAGASHRGGTKNARACPRGGATQPPPLSARSRTKLTLGTGQHPQGVPERGLQPTAVHKTRRNFQVYRAEGLLDRMPGARGPHPNPVVLEVEEAILAHPTHGGAAGSRRADAPRRTGELGRRSRGMDPQRTQDEARAAPPAREDGPGRATSN